jgi:dipeptidyl aminopeptidase/acylaminoacyl peptidase
LITSSREESEVFRYANFAIHPTCTNLIVAIVEDHTVDVPSAVVNALCLIDTAKSKVYPLVSGADFYAAPTFSPDGTRFAWQQWFFPDMSWEGAEIHAADVQIEDGTLKLKDPVHVAGKRGEISVSYPFWVSNHTLVFTSDESGYQNPWMYSPGFLAKAQPVFDHPVAQDFGGPAWLLGGSPFAPLDSIGKRVVFTATRDGRSVLYVADLENRSAPQEVDCPYVVIQSIRQAAAGQPEVVFIGSKTNGVASVVHCRLSWEAVLGTFTKLKSTVSDTTVVPNFPPEIIAAPQPMSLQVPPNNDPVHVIFYPPTNPDYAGSSIQGERPPCVLNVHGGPTSMTTQALDWKRIFYTSRGWAW